MLYWPMLVHTRCIVWYRFWTCLQYRKCTEYGMLNWPSYKAYRHCTKMIWVWGLVWKLRTLVFYRETFMWLRSIEWLARVTKRDIGLWFLVEKMIRRRVEWWARWLAVVEMRHAWTCGLWPVRMVIAESKLSPYYIYYCPHMHAFMCGRFNK